MPDEVFAIVIVSIIAGTLTTIFRIIFSKKGIVERGTQTPGLKASELREMIEDAVQTATLPLSKKIDRIEKQLRAPSEIATPVQQVKQLQLDEEIEQGENEFYPNQERQREQS